MTPRALFGMNNCRRGKSKEWRKRKFPSGTAGLGCGIAAVVEPQVITNCTVSLIPCPGTSTCCRYSQRKKKKRERERESIAGLEKITSLVEFEGWSLGKIWTPDPEQGSLACK